MISETSAEHILNKSRDVILTGGEWELADITVSSCTLEIAERSHSEIQCNVSTFNYDHLFSIVIVSSMVVTALLLIGASVGNRNHKEKSEVCS